MTTHTIDDRAQALFEQHQDGARFSPFTGAAAIAGITDAYAIQDRYVARMLAAEDERIAGYKIGLTSPRMQALLGIDSPIAGHILSRRIFTSGCTIKRSAYVNLGIECEIVVRLGRDLPPGSNPYSEADIAAAVAAVCAGIELVDDRAADYGATDIGSLVADNSWNAGVVLGEFVTAWPDLAAVEGVVTRDGHVLDRGRGADVLGHPFTPLRWLAEHLAAGDRGLRAGDIVATGSMIPTRMPDAPEHCVFSVTGLGDVAIEIVD